MKHKTKILVLIVSLLLVLAVFLGGCTKYVTNEAGEYVLNEAGEKTTEIDWLYTGILLVGVAAIFYFLMFRPQRKRQKEQKELMEGLQRGDNVITIGGIYGQIESMDEETIVIKVESGTNLRLTRAAIAGKRKTRGS
jgi:preprotein translocase subunit YajC